jgi:hypothetical protein
MHGENNKAGGDFHQKVIIYPDARILIVIDYIATGIDRQYKGEGEKCLYRGKRF